MSRGSEPTRSVRVLIEGRVQGVGFRHWVEQTAGRLALGGWVRNRRDGAVEALFCGPADKVAGMIERCRSGPPAAEVVALRVEEDSAEDTPRYGFAVLPTV